jgi:pyrimidine operon attenuation protein/uracil phosphoribosyltransferase
MSAAAPDVKHLIENMARELRALIERQALSDPLMIGIHTGGVWVAEKLHRLLRLPGPLGVLDISFYRDDFTRLGLHPVVKPSRLPFNVEERHIILVDDVLYTGRTIRASLNEIFDYGRPAGVTLAVLVDRGGRELPIEARVAGARMELRQDEYVKLNGPDPLTLMVQRKS